MLDSSDNGQRLRTLHVGTPLGLPLFANRWWFSPKRAPVTLASRDHRCETQYSWPVEPGRRLTSRAASKKEAACRPSLSFAARNGGASDGWRIFARVGPAVSCRCRPIVAVRTAPSARWTGWFCSFAMISGTKEKSPSSHRAIPRFNGSGSFCRRTVPLWMEVPATGRTPTRFWRRDGCAQSEALGSALSSSEQESGQPRWH
jgi:hypothetical protein